MIRTIAHPTDLSPEGAPAFEHALRLALVNRCQFNVLHVRRPDENPDWDSFPRVREVLQRWGYLEPGASTEGILARTGVTVTKTDIRDIDAVDGLSRYLETHPSDLIVAASHGRAGLHRLLNNSVSAKVAQVSLIPTMIFGPGARPFVDSQTGSLESVKTVLVPVDHDPAPNDAVRQIQGLSEGLDVEFEFVHVGRDAPVVRDAQRTQRPVRTVEGPVIETILDEARRVSLVAMPMAGRRGLLDALRGSTTERIISEASCPVLAIPVTS